MRFTEERTRTELVVVQVVCDRCGVKSDDPGQDLQEWGCYSHLGGYGARHFHDGWEGEVDLCEACVHDLFSSCGKVPVRGMVGP